MGLCGSKKRTSENPPEKQIFILAGQSNMSGRGGVATKKWDGNVPPQCQPNPSILRLNARLRWEEAHEPLHADIDTAKTCGVGPGMSFANAFIAGEQCAVVGLVPCAVGGTSIREWRKGGKLYGAMVKRAKAALKQGGSIRALLWYQGESDTGSIEKAESYRGDMEKLVLDFRNDMGCWELLVIQVAISSGDGSFVEKVREAQFGVDLEGVYCVDSKGLPLKEDHLHLTTDGQVKLGQMMAEEYFKHCPSASSHHL